MAIAESLFKGSVLLIGILVFVLYLAGLAIYRLTFDPLAKIPGPKLAAITRYYEAYYDVMCNGAYTFKIDKLHRKYGPIVRISPYEIHIKDPAFFGQLYRQDGNWEKYEWVQRAFAAGPRSAFITTPHDLHRMRRAPLDQFFSKTNVNRRQNIIRVTVNKLHERIAEIAAKGEVFDLGDALAATATDIATGFIFGTSFDNLDHADFNTRMTFMIRSHGKIWRATKHITFLAPILLAMPLTTLEKIAGEDFKAFSAFLRYNKAQVEAELARLGADGGKDVEEYDSLVQSILKSKTLPPTEKDFDRLNNEADQVASAGIESAGQTLRMIFFHVYKDPRILRRLREELTDVSKLLGPDAPAADWAPLLQRLERLPYLTAIIKEGLRMSPGIATRMARIAPDREIQYQSYSIPAGTPVSMTTLLMHFDENEYPDPWTFTPERWLSPDSNKQGEKVYAPFARGGRMCVGIHLAYAELYMVIATMAANFDIELINAKAEDILPDHDSFVIGTKEKHGPHARAILLS